MTSADCRTLTYMIAIWPKRIGLTVLITVLAPVLTPLPINFPVLFSTPLVLAQTSVANRKLEADRLQQQGNQQARMGESLAALQSWQNAVTIYREIANSPDGDRFTSRTAEADTLNLIGNVYFRTRQSPQALVSYQQALAIYEELSNRAGIADTLGYIGDAYFRLGQYHQVRELFEQKLKTVREKGDHEGERAILATLTQKINDPRRGWAYSLYSNNFNLLSSRNFKDLKDYSWEEKLELLQLNLFIRRELSDRIAVADTLHDIGWAYRNLGQYSQALESFEQVFDISREIGDAGRSALGFTLTDAGLVYIDLGQYNRALDALQRALTIHRQEHNPVLEQLTLGYIGLAYKYIHQYDRALEFLNQALAIQSSPNRGETLNYLGLVYAEMGDYPQALESYEQALKTSVSDNPGLQGFYLKNIGSVYAQMGNYSQALEYYQRALAVFQQLNERPGQGITLTHIGDVLLQSGRLTEAAKTLSTAVEVLESLRPGLSDANKVSIFETQALTYRLLQQAMIAQNKTNAALEIAERGRARAFVELLAMRLSSNLTAEATINPPTLQQIRQIAKQQQATLIEYSIVSDQELYIWVVKPTGEVTFRQVNLISLENSLIEVALTSPTTTRSSQGTSPKNPRLGDLVMDTRNSLFSVRRAFTTAKLQQLYQVLIQPIAELLPTDPSSRIIFIPQGELFSVPFPALVDASGKYLIEKHALLMAPAIQVLDLTHQQWQKIQQAAPQDAAIIGIPRKALVIGNPQMPSFGEPPQPLNPLPGAEEEAKAIAALLNTQAITGRQATKAAVVQQMLQSRIIHLATHGLIDDIRGKGVPGAIALTPSGSDNGLLTSDEILDLKLNAELVVLSACDTGQGRLTGDGVIGLSRSFITAGTSSIIVSLWAVPDEATAFLMPEFYRQLQRNRDKAQALQQAMLMTMKQYPEPENWAAFTLIGEAE